MFEDLIEKRNTEKKEINLRSQCPHCHSYSISKSAKYMRVDDRWRQAVECQECKERWALIYSEDLSSVWLEKC